MFYHHVNQLHTAFVEYVMQLEYCGLCSCMSLIKGFGLLHKVGQNLALCDSFAYADAREESTWACGLCKNAHRSAGRMCGE